MPAADICRPCRYICKIWSWLKTLTGHPHCALGKTEILYPKNMRTQVAMDFI